MKAEAGEIAGVLPLCRTDNTANCYAVFQISGTTLKAQGHGS